MAINFYYYGNLLPTISSVTPTPATIALGSAVSFTSASFDADGSVVSVEYFLDGVSRGIGTTSPNFPLNFTPTTTGNSRPLTAIATDNLGAKSALFSGTAVTVNGASTTPGAMAQPTGVVNSATSITLTYAAPNNGGSPITDYLYSYSSNGGSTYTVFPHTATTALSQAITGLTPGTNYQFRVAAINAIGTGAFSTPDLLLSTPAAALVYDSSITIPASGTATTAYGLTLSGPVGAKVEFNRVASTGALPVHLNLLVAGTIVAGLDFESSYVGGRFRFTTPAGTVYSGTANTFQSAASGLTLS